MVGGNLADNPGIFKISDAQAAIQTELEALLERVGPEDRLKQAVEYVLKSGGRRLRPLLMLSLLWDLGREHLNFTKQASALELLHISSLVHDDLPALDNDSMRRGAPTCHIKFDEATALLAGDALIVLAFSQIAASGDIKGASASVQILSQAFYELCRGQELDRNINADSHAKIALLKTGALFRASLLLPLYLTEAAASACETAARFGENLGLLYQMCDDLADQTNSAALKGREVSSDQKNNKNTFFSSSAAEKERGLIYTKDLLEADLRLLDSHIKGRGLQAFRSCLNFMFEPFANSKLIF